MQSVQALDFFSGNAAAFAQYVLNITEKHCMLRDKSHCPLKTLTQNDCGTMGNMGVVTEETLNIRGFCRRSIDKRIAKSKGDFHDRCNDSGTV